MAEVIRKDDIVMQQATDNNSSHIYFFHKSTTVKDPKKVSENYFGNDRYVIYKNGNGNYQIDRRLFFNPQKDWPIGQEIPKDRFLEDDVLLEIIGDPDFVNWLQAVVQNPQVTQVVVDFNEGEWMAHLICNGALPKDRVLAEWRSGFAKVLTSAQVYTDLSNAPIGRKVFQPQISEPFGESFYPFLEIYVQQTLSQLSQNPQQGIDIFGTVFDPKKEDLSDVFNRVLEKWQVPYRVFLGWSQEKFEFVFGTVTTEALDQGRRVMVFDRVVMSSYPANVVYGVTNDRGDHAILLQSMANEFEYLAQIPLSNFPDKKWQYALSHFQESWQKADERYGLILDYAKLIEKHENRHHEVSQEYTFLHVGMMNKIPVEDDVTAQIYKELEEMDADVQSLLFICELAQTDPKAAKHLLEVFILKLTRNSTFIYPQYLRKLVFAYTAENPDGSWQIDWKKLQEQSQKLQNLITNWRNDLRYATQVFILHKIFPTETQAAVMENGYDFNDQKDVETFFNELRQEAIKKRFPADVEQSFAITKIHDDWLKTATSSKDGLWQEFIEKFKEQENQISKDLDSFFKNLPN